MSGKLIHVSDTDPGLSRRRSGKGFVYRKARGKPVRDKAALARIRALAIPPAWTDVWICAKANGHLQASGRDARGRKQHRYHALYREHRDAAKFEHLSQFAKALPAIRARARRDTNKKGMPREKVVGAIVGLLDSTLIRVGNDEYAKTNKSYGLTTLKDQHAQIKGEQIRFVFTGKSGKDWRLTIKDRRIARIVKAAQDLPGQRLFQYLDEGGKRQNVTSTDVNDYLRDASGAEISAKDFRTWGGSVLAAAALAAFQKPKTKALAQANIKAAIDEVALSLGNTPTICRKCYVHPALLDAYTEGRLLLPNAKRKGLSAHEASVASFLSRLKAASQRGGGYTRT